MMLIVPNACTVLFWEHSSFEGRYCFHGAWQQMELPVSDSRVIPALKPALHTHLPFRNV